MHGTMPLEEARQNGTGTTAAPRISRPVDQSQRIAQEIGLIICSRESHMHSTVEKDDGPELPDSVNAYGRLVLELGMLFIQLEDLTGKEMESATSCGRS